MLKSADVANLGGTFSGASALFFLLLEENPRIAIATKITAIAINTKVNMGPALRPASWMLVHNRPATLTVAYQV